MTLFVKISLSVCLLLTTLSAQEDLKFENIYIDKGLSESIVKAIVQDDAGFASTVYWGSSGDIYIPNGFYSTKAIDLPFPERSGICALRTHKRVPVMD